MSGRLPLAEGQSADDRDGNPLLYAPADRGRRREPATAARIGISRGIVKEAHWFLILQRLPFASPPGRDRQAGGGGRFRRRGRAVDLPRPPETSGDEPAGAGDHHFVEPGRRLLLGGAGERRGITEPSARLRLAARIARRARPRRPRRRARSARLARARRRRAPSPPNAAITSWGQAGAAEQGGLRRRARRWPPCGRPGHSCLSAKWAWKVAPQTPARSEISTSVSARYPSSSRASPAAARSCWRWSSRSACGSSLEFNRAARTSLHWVPCRSPDGRG